MFEQCDFYTEAGALKNGRWREDERVDLDVEDVAIAVETEEKLGWGVKGLFGPPIAIRKEKEEKIGHRRHSKKRSCRPSPNPNHRPIIHH